MSLEALEQVGEIGLLASSKSEISNLIDKANRKLRDSKVRDISAETRLEQAYTAILTCAVIALRATGYRVLNLSAMHYITIETTRFTLNLDSEKVDYLQALRIKRHQDIYGEKLIISESDLTEAINEAESLITLIEKWLLVNYPHLILKGK